MKVKQSLVSGEDFPSWETSKLAPNVYKAENWMQNALIASSLGNSANTSSSKVT